VLLGERPSTKVYAGYWEFPGGKIEPGETAMQALARELGEELGIRVVRADPWLTQSFVYPHASVRIHFFRVKAWEGVPRAKEHAALAWQLAGAFTVNPMLPANAPILRALALPDEYAISDAERMGAAAFLRALERRLVGGLRLVQLREKAMPIAELRALASEVQARCRAHGAELLVNGDWELAQSVGAAGIHLSAARLSELRERPPFAWVAASCHDAGELARTADLGLDFAVLGPVKATPSHAGARLLGWPGFSSLASDCRVPVFAIGGMRAGDLDHATACGAHGIAMITGAWL
jgi:8-oxo-dGTP diphosphatase